MFGWTPAAQRGNRQLFAGRSTLSIFRAGILTSDIAQSFHVGPEQVTLAILLTLAVRPIGALIRRAAEKAAASRS